MDKVLQRWNDKWKTTTLKFSTEGLNKNVCEFFEQLTIQNIDSCDYFKSGYYITLHIDCKNEVTNKHFRLLFVHLGDGFLIQKKEGINDSALGWNHFFETDKKDLEMDLKIDSILLDFDFTKMLEEAERYKTEELRNILLQNTTIPDDIKQTKSFQTFFETGLLRLNEEEFLCLFWNVGEGEDEDEDEIEYPAVYAKYENEECYDEEITKWKTDPKRRLIYLVNDYGNPNELIEKSIIGFIEYAEKYNKEGK